MIREAIILAGGLGTRLRSVVPELPKCLAPVGGRPFISHVIDYLRMQGVQRIVFSLGYRAELIEEYLQQQYPTLDYTAVVEQEPLGTGGAVQFALRQSSDKNVVVTNGDTLFRADLHQLAQLHLSMHAECTLALKPMQEFSRYGVVEIDAEGRITSCKEKKEYHSWLINGVMYLLVTE